MIGRTRQSSPRGFSLLEILIAVGILGLALIGIAAVFPVGATWTRQTIEETVAQNVALNAVNVIKTSYAYTDFTAADTSVYAVPGQGVGGKLPLRERAYGFNEAIPYPATLATGLDGSATAEYYWTALYRLPFVGSHNITLYILVFRKGDPTQNFAVSPADVPNARDTTESIGTGFPRLAYGTYSTGSVNSAPDNDPNIVSGALPQVGSFGVVAQTGGVFRQGLNATGSAADPHVYIPAAPNNLVIYSPPPDFWPNSPLVYVYQTTLSF